ncbi:MAG: acetate--CoA ligase family protein [Myxococcales bacterium]|nr:acetate--CoA ligase family protein [Myxococcales bacterium]
MNGLEALFAPRSVAVIGASRREKSVGYQLVANLVKYGYDGPVYPVNPAARSVHSVPAYPNLASIPDDIDLAVITVPSHQVLEAMDDVIAKGVKAVVTITAGFKEVGAEGAKLERALKRKVREAGIRMVGPNCMGIVNTDPAVRLNASFTASEPPVGGVAVASQSGALGEAILETAADLGIGLSSFVSLGNKADVSGNDLIQFWADDPRTKMALLYLESFGNPRRFARLARYMTKEKKKPILAVKSGRSRRGAEAASSHTGSLAGADEAIDSLLKQCGVIRVDTAAQLFAAAQAFAAQPVPSGRRVGILTNAGGPGIMATDAAVHFGLELAELAPETRAQLQATLPPEASVRNPVDAIATAGGEEYRACTELILRDPGVDALLVIFVSPVMIDAEQVARAVVEGIEAARPYAPDKPVLSCFMGKHKGDVGLEVLRAASVPVYPFPEGAAQSLARMAKFGEYLRRPPGVEPVLDPPPRVAEVAQVLDAFHAAHPEGGWLRFPDAMQVLDAYGVPTPAWARVDTPAAAVEFAEQHGYPIVLKVDSDTILHKSEHGGVRVDLRRAQDVRGAFAEIRANVDDTPGDHALVAQRMMTGDAEVLMGVTVDRMVGHLLAFGLGGVFTEVMQDVVFRAHPLTDQDASDMIEGIRGYPILSGARGGHPVDKAALEDVLLRLSRLVGDFPEIVEMDLNPFLAHRTGARQSAVDARIRVAPTPPSE